MVMCHNREPSPLQELAEVALGAAYTLDEWSLRKDSLPNDVLRLARKLERICAESMSMALIVSRAYQKCNPRGVLRTVGDLALEIGIIHDRLLQTTMTRNMGVAHEVASLRDFCVELSRQALTRA